MPRTTHGHTWRGGSSRTYRIWVGMLRRCRSAHPSWGGKGIKVCERWQVFTNFLADVGEIPPGLSLDRTDPDGDYEPGNVRLATPREQNLNKRNTRLLTIGDVTKPLVVWAEEIKVSSTSLLWRVEQGWPEDRLLTPAGRNGGKGGPGHGNMRHGASRTRTYRLWSGMIRRCREEPNYAGRGIKVCARWETFENFLADVGEIPDGLTLDRIDGGGDYEPGNVRLASPKEQARNRRSNRRVTINGVTKLLVEWGEEAGLSALMIAQRIAAGWPEDQLLLPAGATVNVHLTVGGRTLTLAEWAQESGLKTETVWQRFQAGWPPEKCISPARVWTPRRSSRCTSLTVDGRTQTLTGWSRETGVRVNTISRRVLKGLPPEKCIAPDRVCTTLTVDGRTQTLAAWSRETGVKLATIYSRMGKGYPPEKCIAPAPK